MNELNGRKEMLIAPSEMTPYVIMGIKAIVNNHEKYKEE